MISRSRRKRDGWFSKFNRKRKPLANMPGFLTESDFALAVEKERCRAERRELSFCIALFDVDSDPKKLSSDNPLDWQQVLAARFRKRLRITDEIGTFRNTFAVLFPETTPSQAALVIRDLLIAGDSCGLVLTAEIFSYPEVGGDRQPPNGHRHDGSFELDTNSKPSASSNEFSRIDPASSQLKPNISVAEPEVETKSHAEPDVQDGPAQSFRVSRLNTQIATPVWKRSLDLFGASVGLVMLSPLFAVTAILVRNTSPGPAFFKQWREGKDGQLFEIYKFRTMRLGADDEKNLFRDQSEQDGPAFKLENDPRLTKIGRYLRKTCIDELPQLINVVKGEMSLVGPRPLPVDESLNCASWHRRRLDVLPGMTCIWQVDGGRDIPFDDWMRMDLDYVRKSSLRTDAGLIFKTVFVTVMHRGSV